MANGRCRGRERLPDRHIRRDRAGGGRQPRRNLKPPRWVTRTEVKASLLRWARSGIREGNCPARSPHMASRSPADLVEQATVGVSPSAVGAFASPPGYEV